MIPTPKMRECLERAVREHFDCTEEKAARLVREGGANFHHQHAAYRPEVLMRALELATEDDADTVRLDKLQAMTQFRRSDWGWIARMSIQGLGFRLHETKKKWHADPVQRDVRSAIDAIPEPEAIDDAREPGRRGEG